MEKINQIWSAEIEKIAEILNTSLSDGISTSEAGLRLEKYGQNKLEEKKGRSPLSLFLDQFRDFIIS